MNSLYHLDFIDPDSAVCSCVFWVLSDTADVLLSQISCSSVLFLSTKYTTEDIQRDKEENTSPLWSCKLWVWALMWCALSFSSSLFVNLSLSKSLSSCDSGDFNPPEVSQSSPMPGSPSRINCGTFFGEIKKWKKRMRQEIEHDHVLFKQFSNQWLAMFGGFKRDSHRV